MIVPHDHGFVVLSDVPVQVHLPRYSHPDNDIIQVRNRVITKQEQIKMETSLASKS